MLVAALPSVLVGLRVPACQIVVKGVMTKEEAAEALRHGVDGVWVSNHGGRQLDTLPATIEVLPEVTERVQYFL